MREYATVRTSARIESTIRKSRFIGYCAPVETEEAAIAYVEDIRKRHRDATHNCYAYCIGAEGGAARFSDDGEPGGTAGLPMMEAIKGKGLTNLVCVVTRYFGGILLGAGGLTRAYSKTACAAMEEAGLVVMRPCKKYSVVCAYGRWGILEPLMRSRGQISDLFYTDVVTAEVIIPSIYGEDFVQTVWNKTDGTVMPKEEESLYGAFYTEDQGS